MLYEPWAAQIGGTARVLPGHPVTRRLLSIDAAMKGSVLLEAWQPAAIGCAGAVLCIEMCRHRRNARADGHGRDVRPWRDLLSAGSMRLPGVAGRGREGQAAVAEVMIPGRPAGLARGAGRVGSVARGGSHP